jgi:hypothetical protein
MKVSEIKEDIKKKLGAELVSKNKRGNYVAYWGFFYTFGKTANNYAIKVKGVLPESNIVNCGQHWAPFRGGSTVKQGSHFWVEFTI